jgi:hypothetical protein
MSSPGMTPPVRFEKFENNVNVNVSPKKNNVSYCIVGWGGGGGGDTARGGQGPS